MKYIYPSKEFFMLVKKEEIRQLLTSPFCLVEDLIIDTFGKKYKVKNPNWFKKIINHLLRKEPYKLLREIQ